MEFPFDINHLFSERISVLDQELVAGRKSIGRPDLQVQIATVIDELGKASAKAQQLPAPITTASKLQSNKHHLYLFKDGERNGGRGAAVGFLKVGYKKLFLLDQRGAHIEAEPLCILDFFICENLQRHGYGLELFEFILQHKNLQPVLMAYDRPSPKFLSFLAKHFCLTESVPQVNNFVVFDGFFLNRSVAQWRKAPPKKQEGEIKPYSLMEREVVREERRVRPWPFVRPAPPPLSPQRSASSQCSRSLSVGSSPSREPQPQRPAMPSAPAPGGYTGQTPHSPLIDNCRARRTSQQGLVAGANLYSRHFSRRDVGFLLGRQERSTFTLPGLRPVLTDTGRQTHALGQTDRSPPLSLPPLCTSKKDALCSLQTPVVARETAAACDADTESGCRSERSAQAQGSWSCSAGGVQVHHKAAAFKVEHAGGVQVHHKAAAFKVERDRNNASGWSSSTLGESSYTGALWVKQKQEYRSTRPW